MIALPMASQLQLSIPKLPELPASFLFLGGFFPAHLHPSWNSVCAGSPHFTTLNDLQSQCCPPAVPPEPLPFSYRHSRPTAPSTARKLGAPVIWHRVCLLFLLHT